MYKAREHQPDSFVQYNSTIQRKTTISKNKVEKLQRSTTPQGNKTRSRVYTVNDTAKVPEKDLTSCLARNMTNTMLDTAQFDEKEALDQSDLKGFNTSLRYNRSPNRANSTESSEVSFEDAGEAHVATMKSADYIK